MGVSQTLSMAMAGLASTRNTKPNRDKVEILLGISEGPIQGLVNGNKTFYIGDTPIQNPDNSYNFSGVSVDVLPGNESPTPIQLTLGGLSASTSVGEVLFSNVPVTRSMPVGNINAIELRFLVQSLFDASGSGEPKATSVSLKIEYKLQSSGTWLPFTEMFPYVLTGKFLNSNPIEFRKVVAVDPSSYDVRVTKLSAESTSTIHRDVAWESFQRINNGPLSFPNTATAHFLGIASNQFQSVPSQLKGIYRGVLCRIPSNYNPLTRVYTGIWDGTFTIGWTNNNAFIFQEAVLNTKWGVNSFYPCTVDKYDVYEAAQWCDGLVSNGSGGFEPRFTFNAYVTEGLGGKEFLNLIAGTFNGKAYDDLNGTIVLAVEMNSDAVALFTPENVVGGLFDYSATDPNTRYNDLTIKFLNKTMNYGEDRRRVFDQTLINLEGRKTFDFVPVGSTGAQESIRRGYFRLISATTEISQCSFKTNRLGMLGIKPFEIILISDITMGYAISGRVKAISGDRLTLTLRDAISVENAVEYTVNFQTENGLLVRTFIATSTAAVTSIVFAAALPAGIEEFTTFSIGGASGMGLPKPYRVLSIGEGAHPDEVDVFVLEVNRNKFAAADEARLADVIQYADRRVTDFVLPPTNIRVEYEAAFTPSGLRQYLRVIWDASTDPYVTLYRVDFQRNGENAVSLPVTSNTEIRLYDPPAGDYVFYVYSINILGFQSKPQLYMLNAGEFAPPDAIGAPEISGFELEGAGLGTTFTTKHAKFSWRFSSSILTELGDEPVGAEPGYLTLFKYFEFRIRDADTGETVFTDYPTTPSYLFTYDVNLATGGPRRQFYAEVRYVSTFNQVSAWASLLVSNPPPPEITSFFSVGGPGISALHWQIPADSPDLLGYYVWRSSVSGFTPDAFNFVADTPDNRWTINGLPGTTQYVIVAAYDTYGGTFIMSAQQSVVIPLINTGYYEGESVTTPIIDENAATLSGIANGGSLTVNSTSFQTAQTLVQTTVGGDVTLLVFFNIQRTTGSGFNSIPMQITMDGTVVFSIPTTFDRTDNSNNPGIAFSPIVRIPDVAAGSHTFLLQFKQEPGFTTAVLNIRNAVISALELRR